MSSPLRVFQVASGNVGTEMVRRIQKHPDLELVGLHCYSPEKVGRDVGEIVGIGPTGVTATGTIDEILAAGPDCLTFHGVWPDIGLYEKVLEAGINQQGGPRGSPAGSVSASRARTASTQWNSASRSTAR